MKISPSILKALKSRQRRYFLLGPWHLLIPAIIICHFGLLTAKGTTPDETPTVTVRAYTGEMDPYAATGADYLNFYTPETGAFLGLVAKVTGSASDLQDNGILPEFPNAQIIGLSQPSGKALLATFKPGVGGITARNNVALLDGTLEEFNELNVDARTGTGMDGLSEGDTIKSFGTIDGNYDLPFLLAYLTGPGTNSHNRLALCDANPNADPDFNDLLQNGAIVYVYHYDTETTSTETTESFTTLVGSHTTLAQGRWRCDYGGYFEGIERQDEYLVENDIGVRITFKDHSQGLFIIPSYAGNQDAGEWATAAISGTVGENSELEGYTITGFGLPCFGQDDYASLVTLAHGPVNIVTPPAITAHPSLETVVTSSNDVAVVSGILQYTEQYLIAEKGDPVTEDANGNPLTGVTISGFSDPVVGGSLDVAFMLTLNGIPGGPNNGIMYSPDSETPFLIANVGAAAPGGGHWAGFTSLVEQIEGGNENSDPVTVDFSTSDREYLGDPGPIFVGTLAISQDDGVTAGSNEGMWGVDGDGHLILLLRTGQTVMVNSVTETIKSFVALAAAPGSVGAASGYDNNYDVAAVATFTDGSKALLNIQMPIGD